MKFAQSRTAPISIHLERHRRCLERHRKERGDAAAAADDTIEVSNLPPRIRCTWALPFTRRDDDD